MFEESTVPRFGYRIVTPGAILPMMEGVVTPRGRSFPSPAAFRAWLEAHHGDATELVIRLFKVHAASRGLTYRQALDEALCFGWIDGVRRALDGDSFTQRFTPRRRGSVWSAVNIRRMRELEAEGRVAPPGRAAFAAATSAKGRYSFESPPMELSTAYRRRLAAQRAASAFWESRPPWYRRTAAFWVMSAKKEETRDRRFETLLERCARGEAVPPLAGSATKDGARRKPASRRTLRPRGGRK